MRTTIAGLLLLAATTTAQADPDDVPSPDNPTPPVPDPANPQPDQVPPPIAEPVPTPQPQPTPTIDNTSPPPTTNVIVNPPPTIEHEKDWAQRAGFSLTLGGGVEGFTSDVMRNTTQTGGDWTVRAGFGTNLPIGVEAAYIGSAQDINALGLDRNALLVGNGVQGDVRINGTWNLPVQPFIFGGVAWRRYSIRNADFNTSDVRDKDDVLEVPVGAGVGFKAAGFTLDLRGEFRPSFYNNLVPDVRDNNPSHEGNAGLHRWGANASVGYEF